MEKTMALEEIMAKTMDKKMEAGRGCGILEPKLGYKTILALLISSTWSCLHSGPLSSGCHAWDPKTSWERAAAVLTVGILMQTRSTRGNPRPQAPLEGPKQLNNLCTKLSARLGRFPIISTEDGLPQHFKVAGQG